MRGNSITDRNGKLNPNYKYGLRKTRLYRIWANMKSRCNNPKFTQYNRYGGRGIRVCAEWETDFKAFYDWAMSNGYADDLTIDRIDNNGNYSPENCRWATVKEQNNNRSKNVIVNINGESKTLSQWCEFYKINYKTVRDRLGRGWLYDRALSFPADVRFRVNKL